MFKVYWPDYDGKIYLNTETKEYSHQGLNIISIKNNLSGQNWSNCLRYAVNSIKEDSFIYMQEDYFLRSAVNTNLVEDMFFLFKEKKYDCLHLTDQCTSGPFLDKPSDKRIWKIANEAEYRVSTQAAFWKKSTMLEIIRPWESGWDFEKYASKRSINHNFMCVNQEIYKKNNQEIIPYIFTGIIKGKWKKEVSALFEA